MNETILKFRKELQNLGYCKTVINSYPKQITKFLNYTRKEHLEIQTGDILDYYSYLKTVISPRTKKHLSESGIAGKMRAIRMYFDYLQRTGQRKENPYQLKIKSPKSQERKIFTTEEIKRLYDFATLQQTIILHLCYACGMRRNEAVELKTSDIDLENCLLYIRKGKGKKRRVIPFTKQVKNDFEKFIFSTENKTEKLLNLSGNGIYREFKKLLKKVPFGDLGAHNFTLHCLRHTIATQLLEQGMELEKVRDFLGHEYLGTTQIYTRINYGTGKIFRK